MDLIFLNDQYCHFRQSIYNIIEFCKHEDRPCEGIGANLQMNMFGMITQVSSIIQTFTAQKWSDLDVLQRGATLHQLGQSITGIATDVIGYHPTF